MEEKRSINNAGKDESFFRLLELGQKGDKKALEEILSLFEPDIIYLAAFIKLPREDTIQTLKTELLEMVIKGVDFQDTED